MKNKTVWLTQFRNAKRKLDYTKKIEPGMIFDINSDPCIIAKSDVCESYNIISLSTGCSKSKINPYNMSIDDFIDSVFRYELISSLCYRGKCLISITSLDVLECSLDIETSKTALQQIV